jgi:hypothetical protein
LSSPFRYSSVFKAVSQIRTPSRARLCILVVSSRFFPEVGGSCSVNLALGKSATLVFSY